MVELARVVASGVAHHLAGTMEGGGEEGWSVREGRSSTTSTAETTTSHTSNIRSHISRTLFLSPTSIHPSIHSPKDRLVLLGQKVTPVSQLSAFLPQVSTSSRRGQCAAKKVITQLPKLPLTTRLRVVVVVEG